MKYYLIAGEASGDLHAARLMMAIKKEDPQANFRFWGGDQMAEQGGVLVKHFKTLAFMGFWEVFIHLRTILKNIAFCKEDIQKFEPDVILYIDYPGFNLRIAKWAKLRGYKNHYYISPQIWAWKESRIIQIKRNLDALYVILPFEEAYYREKHQYHTQYVGNPLMEVVDAHRTRDTCFFERHAIEAHKPIIALLPGSRKQEIKKMMPVFFRVINAFPSYHFVLAGAPGINRQFYDQVAKNKDVTIIENDTYSLLNVAFAAIVTSGTATLETALFGVPQMVCYKSSWLSYLIARNVLKLRYISLVNLILDQEIVKELIQFNCTAEKIIEELKRISQQEERKKITKNYQVLKHKLGTHKASQKVAQAVIEKIKK